MTIVTFDDLFRATLWLFLVIFDKKVCETNLNFSYQQVRNQKKRQAYNVYILLKLT